MQHYEIKPDQRSIALSVANKALKVANGLSTARPGSIYIPNKDANGMTDGTGTYIGSGSLGNGGVAQWIGDTTPPGRPLGISASGSAGVLIVTWTGELDGGIPEDFAYVRVFAKANDVTSVIGDLATVGAVSSVLYPGGTDVEVWAVAYDAARNPTTGELSPNASGESDHVEVTIVSSSTELAQEALDAANAINQHFWSDDNGIHVSTDENNAEGTNNILINALGILLRAAHNNLLGLTPTGVAIYDGEGNEESNIVATFTKDQIDLGINSINSSIRMCSYGEIKTNSQGNGVVINVRDGTSDISLNASSARLYAGRVNPDGFENANAYILVDASTAITSTNIHGDRVNVTGDLVCSYFALDDGSLYPPKMTSYVVDSYYPPNLQTNQSYWGWRKYSDGSCDLWGRQYLTNYNFSGNSGQGHYYGATIVTSLPFGVYWAAVNINVMHDPGIYGWNLKTVYTSEFWWVAWKTSAATENIFINVLVHGWWKDLWP